MSKANHTPGPWCISEAENSFEIIQDCWGDDGDHLGAVVVRAPEIDPENGGIRNKADAILIAAAPDLLEALKHIRRCIPYGGFVQIHDNSMTLAQIDAAIAKAEGNAA